MEGNWQVMCLWNNVVFNSTSCFKCLYFVTKVCLSASGGVVDSSCSGHMKSGIDKWLRSCISL